MLRPLVLPRPRPCAHAKKKYHPSPFSLMYAMKKNDDFSLLKITKRLSALFLKVAARGRLCCSSLVCTLKKAVITEIVRRTLKKLEKQILSMTKYYYYYAKIAFFYNKVRVFFSVSLMKSLKNL